jgi:hypothetical protein
MESCGSQLHPLEICTSLLREDFLYLSQIDFPLEHARPESLSFRLTHKHPGDHTDVNDVPESFSTLGTV